MSFSQLPERQLRVLNLNLRVLMWSVIPAYVVITVADLVRGFSDPSYWREIPLSTVGVAVIVWAGRTRRWPTARGIALIAALYLGGLSDWLYAASYHLGVATLVTATVLAGGIFGLGGLLAGGLVSIALPSIAYLARYQGWVSPPGQGRSRGGVLSTVVDVVVLSLLAAMTLATLYAIFSKPKGPREGTR